MSRETIVLLPGMDGTGRLFEPFVRESPCQFVTKVISLPRSGSYELLLDAIAPRIREAGRAIVLAESFSGHLAVRLAERFPESVSAVVLCNSFVAPPRSLLLGWLPWSLLFSFSPPPFVVRHFLVGHDASSELVESVRAAVRETTVGVMASRMAAVLAESSVSFLQGVTQPILYLRGAEDRLVPRSSADLVLHAAKHAVSVAIPGPHLLLQRNPRASWAEITRFLAKVN